MYVITNRKIHIGEKGLDIFGKVPSQEGPNELRLVRVNEDGTTELLTNKLFKKEARELAKKHHLKLDLNKDWYASLRVACELFHQATTQEKHLLIFIHGYNNDIEDVIRTVRRIEKVYDVIVVPFSWPANGGGAVSGKIDYLSDKADARASATALHRAVMKVEEYHRLLTQGLQERLWKEAVGDKSENHQNARARFSQRIEASCKTKLSLMCHSMGNYVLKYATLPSDSHTRKLVFDNVCLIAADVNNPEHENWVECIPARNRLYVSINEDDWALKWSRVKPGAEQKARLGHHLRNLVAKNVYYLDVTRNKKVGSEHSYFQGGAIENPTIKRLFSKMFAGEVVEREMQYDANENVYRPADQE